MNPQLQSPLFQIPAELTLTILEYAVLEPEPVLINLRCESSYGDDESLYISDMEAWAEGYDRHPPGQPLMTSTCSRIRDIALPIFYKVNSFQAYYCDHTTRLFPCTPEEWLRRISEANRRMIRDLCFIKCDLDLREDFLRFRRSGIFKDMGGVMETMSGSGHCCYRGHLSAAGGRRACWAGGVVCVVGSRCALARC